VGVVRRWGIGFVAPFGLLLAGLAVPVLIGRLLPRPAAWAGLGIAATALASTFACTTSTLYPLLPAAGGRRSPLPPRRAQAKFFGPGPTSQEGRPVDKSVRPAEL
jgi:hypothetical protein